MGRFVEEDIAGYLEANVGWLRRRSTVTTPGEENFFIGDMPSSPLESVGIYEYPGDQPIYFLGGAKRIERPRIQITTRAEHFVRSREMAHDIFDFMEDVGPLELNGTFYLKIRAIGRPGEASPDAENNVLFTTSFMMWRES